MKILLKKDYFLKSLGVHYVLLCLLTAIVSVGVEAQTQHVKVVEFVPAPGQFVNVLPQSGDGDSFNSLEMCNACTELLNNGGLVSLGSLGGYITVCFDHPVQNGRGSDLRIGGNAFYSSSAPLLDNGARGGSIEPGIVYVGVGSDLETCEWYELAGSEYYTSEVHDFQITYYRPSAEEGKAYLSGSSMDEYVRWHCSWAGSDGERRDSCGWHYKNSFHKQTYWPVWMNADSLTFMSGRLPNNGVDISGNGANWITYRYASDSYGYVDASLKDDDYATFDLDWAVDRNGCPVQLDHCDFIRVQCSVFQQCGWIGETSTEVSLFQDLHLTKVKVNGKDLPYDQCPIVIAKRPLPASVLVPWQKRSLKDDIYYDIRGRKENYPQKGRMYIHGRRKIYY